MWGVSMISATFASDPDMPQTTKAETNWGKPYHVHIRRGPTHGLQDTSASALEVIDSSKQERRMNAAEESVR